MLVAHKSPEGTKEPVAIAAQLLIFQASDALAQQEEVEVKPGYAACHTEASASIERLLNDPYHKLRVLSKSLRNYPLPYLHAFLCATNLLTSCLRLRLHKRHRNATQLLKGPVAADGALNQNCCEPTGRAGISVPGLGITASIP
jgi:hypothetical protein